jgi:hypothetical protein
LFALPEQLACAEVYGSSMGYWQKSLYLIEKLRA